MKRSVAALAAAVALMASSPGVARAQLRGVTAEVTPILGTDGVHAGDELRAALLVRLPDDFHVQSDRPRDPSLIPTALSLVPPAGILVTEIVYPPASDLKQAGADQPLAVFEEHFAIGVRLQVDAGADPGDVRIPARLRYQACNDTTCFAPTTAQVEWVVPVVSAASEVHAQHAEVLDTLAFGSGAAPGTTAVPAPLPTATGAVRERDAVALLDDFTIAGTAGGYMGSDAFLAFIDRAEQGVVETGWFDGKGPLAILLIVLIGGLALNLTPCVLPMIPINLAIIGAGARSGSRRRGFLLGSAYGMAMALVYGVLGVIVVLTAGTFGTINASPWFNAGIAALFVVLGLAMFDVLLIDFSRFSSRIRLNESGRGTFGLAFGMGGVAALLAGACVAPVVIQVVLFSSDLYAGGSRSALALPFLLGVGMAVPWPLAGAGLAALPKPGPWMVRVKQAFGVLILGTAAYYGYQSYELFADRWVDPAAVASSVEAQVREGWHASLAGGLAVARREGKPVLIDLWATWCKNCLTMDKTTLANARVRSALDGYVKVKFQAEDPDEEPVKDVMQRFGAVGLPAYVILHPTGDSQRKTAEGP